MSDIFGKLSNGIRDIFPDAFEMEITPDTKLQDIPDWDSMAGVNLQSFIEQTFKVTIPQDMMGEEMTISELVDLIAHPEKIGETA